MLAYTTSLQEPWRELVFWPLFLCVGTAHNWLVTGKLE